MNFWYAKKHNSYINYLHLFTENPIKLKNTKHRFLAIAYKKSEIKKIIELESNDGYLEIEIIFKVPKDDYKK